MAIKEKKWYQSSTVWLNLIGFIVPVLDMVVKTNLIQDKEVFALILAVLNILNRFRVSPSQPAQPLSKKVI